MNDDNRCWADRIIRKTDPTYKIRADVYKDLILSYLAPRKVWIDIGCGDNSMIMDLGHYTGLAIGTDVKQHTQLVCTPFVCADLFDLPFALGSADLVTLRFVIEHIQNVPKGIAEAERILKPGGHVLIITTNILNPFIFFARLVPFRYKKKMIRSMYDADISNIQPTGNWLNPYQMLKRNTGGLELTHFDFVQDANCARKWLFLLFYSWHLLTKWSNLKLLRTCVVGVLKKKVIIN
ncbi:MAG TPA: class I SAM-dependent methyltransferase [bacterium]